MLICPNCGKELVKTNNSYRCESNHSFDISKSGYVNLLIKHSNNPGDNNESLIARKEFLNKGYYGKMAEQLATSIKKYLKPNEAFLDAGCGTGYYLNKVSAINDLQFYATDIAKKGVEMTSKANKNAVCFVGNVFHLPFSDESLDGLMSVFTPYSGEEFARVIKKGGYVFAVNPGKEHLYDLKKIVYDTPYLNEEKGYDLPGFALVEQMNITYKVTLDCNADIFHLWRMMPYYHTTSKENNDKLLSLNQAETTIDFLLSIYKKEN